MKKWRNFRLVTCLFACAQAQPSGPVNVLYYSVGGLFSISGASLTWLRPDGSYLLLYSYSRFGGTVTYRSGVIGTYTLTMDSSGPQRSALRFDNNGSADILDFSDYRIYAVGSYTFSWDARAASDTVIATSCRALATSDHAAIAGLVSLFKLRSLFLTPSLNICSYISRFPA
jgi:hypothetical protein